ncbi:hypothetical protein [Dokdonella soli]|uniref:Uncharacterized protein n=1 Tax=Dokdonella soli TaxID=529810 RepID=A0ABN1IJC8_9GAMM
MSIPGMQDLIVAASDCEDMARIECAADNVLPNLLFGMSAIGKLIWHAHTHGNEPVEREDMANVGWLLHSLSELADHVMVLRSDTKSHISEGEARLGRAA